MTREPKPSALLELVKTRLREFLREKGAIFWVFFFPLLMAIGLGLAFRSRPVELPRVAVVGENESAQVRALLSSPRLSASLSTRQQARRELARGKVDIVVELGPGGPVYQYDDTREQGLPARLRVDDVLQRAAGRRDALTARDRVVSEPGSRYIDYLLPGLVAMNLMGTSMWGVGYNLVVARKRRLLRRYAVTPMRRSHFLLSYFLARCVFLVLEIAVLLVFGALIFKTELRGTVFDFGLVSLLGAASFAGISLVIGARVDNTESANGWMNLVQLPMWILSGSFFSYERFPTWLVPIIQGLPLTALNDALRAVFNDGAGLLGVLPQVGVLLAWGGIGFLVAARTFRWQ